MRAIVVADKNTAGIGTFETPTPGASEIRVRVKAAALNRADLLVLAGHQHGSGGGLRAILGLECSGEVDSLGQDVTGFAIGDRIMCAARRAIAEYAAPTPAERRRLNRPYPPPPSHPRRALLDGHAQSVSPLRRGRARGWHSPRAGVAHGVDDLPDRRDH
jgi:hypothetical protein